MKLKDSYQTFAPAPLKASLLWILYFSCSNLFALSTPKIIHLIQKDGLYSFVLDFGLFEIRRVQAPLSAKWTSVRLPASLLKSGRSKPEIDFVGEDLEKAVLVQLSQRADSKESAPSKQPNIFLASLEPTEKRKGLKLAQGELWLDNSLAIRFGLMESKWSSDSYHWWVAYPAQFNKNTNRYEELFVIKDKEFKKKILNVVREAYRSRYD